MSESIFVDHEHGEPIVGAGNATACPFCGSDLASVVRADNGALCFVTCERCGSEGPAGASAVEAASRWNRRSTSSD